MSLLSASQAILRFGDFDVDPRSGELRKRGTRIKLQAQPFHVLQVLLEHAGEVVTRKELQNRIWPADTFVDFDHGLNNAVKKLREALGDTSETPRYIETLPKRGYRFIGVLKRIGSGAPASTESTEAITASSIAVPPSRTTIRRTALTVGTILALSAVALALNVRGLRGHVFRSYRTTPSNTALRGASGVARWYPVPIVNQPLTPATVAPRGPAFALTVSGTGFVPGSVVNWNGQGRATTFVSDSELRVKILSSDIATAGTAAVSVVNPRPGGGSSNELLFGFAAHSDVFKLDRSEFYAGLQPDSITVGDFNHDGRLDLAVANPGGGTITIHLGNGDGTFESPVHYAVPQGPFSEIAAGDFNGDGELDLAVSNFSTNDVSVLLGHGDGTFQRAVSYEVGTNPTSVAAADVNGDGKLDLIVSNQNCNHHGRPCSPGTVSVLLGNGDGTFQAHRDFAAGHGPNWVAVGDFNKDGKLDLAVVGGNAGEGNYPAASILLGNGDGTFRPALAYPLKVNASSVAVADFNRDGKLDLAVVDNIGLVSILLGNGDGTFQPRVDYPAGSFPCCYIGIGDFNGDGNLDLAVASSGSNSVTILFGNGDGTFQPQGIRFGTGLTPVGVAVGDFKGNGRLALAVPAKYSNVVSLLSQ